MSTVSKITNSEIPQRQHCQQYHSVRTERKTLNSKIAQRPDRNSKISQRRRQHCNSAVAVSEQKDNTTFQN